MEGWKELRVATISLCHLLVNSVTALFQNFVLWDNKLLRHLARSSLFASKRVPSELSLLGHKLDFLEAENVFLRDQQLQKGRI